MQETLFISIREWDWVTVSVELLGTKWNYILWCPLHDNSNDWGRVSLSHLWFKSISNSSSFAGGAEWNLRFKFAKISTLHNKEILNWLFMIDQHLEKCDINWSSNWLILVLLHLH